MTDHRSSTPRDEKRVSRFGGLPGLARTGLMLCGLVVLAASGPAAFAQSRVDDAYRPPATDSYRAPPPDAYRPPADDTSRPPSGSGPGQPYGGQAYGSPPPAGGAGYGSPGYYGGGNQPPPPQPGYGQGYATNGGYGAPRAQGYGQPYSAPPPDDAPPPRAADGGPTRGYYEQGEIVEKGRGFFGSITQGLASAIEHTYRKSGRPNGYVLGEDGGGAFFAGLRYGEGVLYTKDAGDHKVFWQGPSLGYDVGGEGSKVMVLVYNLSDPSELYQRFGGVEGSAYVVGGVSVQFQKNDDVTLAVIRSGVGLRLGANVGYTKYTRQPTWNPF